MKKSKFLTRSKVLGVTSILATSTLLVGCTNISKEEKPTNNPSDSHCDDFIYNEELDVWECEEKTNNNTRSGSYFFYNNAWHKHNDKNELKNSSTYKNHLNTKSTGLSSGKKTSGFFGG